MNRLVRGAGKALFTAADLALPKLLGPRILIYHQVGSDLGREMEVSERHFVSQLDWMESHGTVVGLDQALASVASPDANHLFVLTFDDGYRDMYNVAWPHLRERRLPFVLYLTTHPVESQQPLSDARAAPLKWHHVEEMLSSGLLTLGSHTHTHPDLRHLPAGEVERELETSDELIQRRVSYRPRHFAYPWGYWSPGTDGLVRQRYQTAALGAPVTAVPFRDSHLVPRLPVQRSDGLVFFRRRMRNGLRIEERVRRRLRRYSARV